MFLAQRVTNVRRPLREEAPAKPRAWRNHTCRCPGDNADIAFAVNDAISNLDGIAGAFERNPHRPQLLC